MQSDDIGDATECRSDEFALRCRTISFSVWHTVSDLVAFEIPSMRQGTFNDHTRVVLIYADRYNHGPTFDIGMTQYELRLSQGKLLAMWDLILSAC